MLACSIVSTYFIGLIYWDRSYLPPERPFPKTGVNESQSRQADQPIALLRIFLRKPLASDKSSISETCQKSKTHTFLQIVDWESEQVIKTAFVRSGEMVEIPLTLGTYQLRHISGTKWYGEEYKFGSKVMDEMTNSLSPDPKKFTVDSQTLGFDIALNCVNGNINSRPAV